MNISPVSLGEINIDMYWLMQLPLWLVFLITTLVVMLSVAIGNLVGRRIKAKPGHETETSLGTIITASLALLAFLLAISFSEASDRLQMRKQLLLNEVNAIGTTYLRAKLLDQPHNNQVRKLLAKYVDLRVEVVKLRFGQTDELKQLILRSQNIHDQLWKHAITIAKNGGPIESLFVTSLNETIDLQTSRLTVFRYRFPSIVWYVLYGILTIAMFIVGYQAGVAEVRSFNAALVLALIFGLVFMMNADLDNPGRGTFQVRQYPIFELQHQIQADLKASGITPPQTVTQDSNQTEPSHPSLIKTK